MTNAYQLLSGQKLRGLHPDGVREALSVFLIYSGEDLKHGGNAKLLDPMARALAAYRSWEDRQR